MSASKNFGSKITTYEFHKPSLVVMAIVEPESQALEPDKTDHDINNREKIRAMIEEFAVNLGKNETDPENFAEWFEYLFKCVEYEFQIRMYGERDPAIIERTLSEIRDRLNKRLEHGRW